MATDAESSSVVQLLDALKQEGIPFMLAGMKPILREDVFETDSLGSSLKILILQPQQGLMRYRKSFLKPFLWECSLA